MKEKIGQLAKEKFEYQMPRLCIEPEKLLIHTEAGRAYEGSIRVTNDAGRRMKGVIFPDSLLFALPKEQFVGEEFVIPFVFHAEHAGAGDRYEGKLVFVTDAGEENLPYEVQVHYPALAAGEESVRDLFQFASLAKADPDMAEALFFGRDFARVIFYHDKRYELLHRVLALTGRKGQAVEEFLIATGKKAAVDLRLEKTEFSYEAGGYNFQDQLVVCKSGWGYVEGEIACDAGFIQLSRTSFSAGDFVDDRLVVDFIVRVQDVPAGKRETKIRVLTPKKELAARLTCVVPHRRAEQRRQRQAGKRAVCELFRIFLAYYCADGNAKHCAEQAKEPLLRLRGAEGTQRDGYAGKLCQLYFWQLAGKDAAVKEGISLLGEKEFAGDAGLLGTFYYLQAIQKKERMSEKTAVEKIRGLYRENPENPELFRCLILLDGEYRDNAHRFFAIREFTAEYGYHVLLLAEAVRILRKDASLLKELGGFELHVLKLALSNGCVDAELARRVVYLAQREKGIRPLLYQVLGRCYHNRPDDELLGAVCALIIRSGRREARDYIWFHRAVTRQLKIAQLPEYYMYCRGEEEKEPIHPNIFLYFSYRCELSDRKKAMLYANLIRHKSEHAALYPKYRQGMEVFAGEQIAKGAVNDSLALIYNEVYRDGMPKEALACLPKVAFAHKLSVKQGRFARVAVFHPGQEEPSYVPVVRGEAVIMLYTEDAEVFLVDGEGACYPAVNLKSSRSGDVHVTVEPLVFQEQNLQACYDDGCTQLPLLLHLKEEENKYQKYGSQPEELSRLLAENASVSEEERESCVRFLMEYYYENYEGDLFEHYLRKIRLEKFTKKERARIIHFFIMRGFDGRAREALQCFGTEEIEVKWLNKLALRCLEAAEQPEADPFLLFLAYYVFECGRCDKELLSYLCRFYHGSTEGMYALWKTAHAEELDTESLEESLLGQILFSESCTGNAQGVFMSYYRYGTNRKLIRAFLNYYAYKFLLNDRMISPEVFELMEREVSLEENDICTLALLKHYAQEEGLSERQKKFLEYKLSGILKKGILLPFFRRFEDFVQLPEELYDKTFVEYHTDPSHRVVLHYRIGDQEQFSEREMKNICHGIFTAGFVLFREESMQYYIAEDADGQTVITESTAAVSADDVVHDGKSRYDILNLILAARQMQDDEAVMKLLENYIRTDYEADHLFRIRNGRR